MNGVPTPISCMRGNLEVDIKRRTRANDTHESETDPGAKLATKSAKAGVMAAYMDNVLAENRNGLVV
ncbi:MAG: hypothetical protein KJZ83_20945 [Burkholderiaceae bacterium]|nr:hypothetical protein [Burkholderiaceae bacterium]